MKVIVGLFFFIYVYELELENCVILEIFENKVEFLLIVI